MASQRLLSVAALSFLITYLSQTYAQQISVNTPIPPLQWLNITHLLQGATAPPLMDAAIGYDDTTRQLIIFGGESASGIPTQQTFLLNLATLVWTTPTPLPNLPQGAPPARSMAMGGEDFSSSYRSAHLIVGGKGAGGTPLSDAWEFDYQDQFWSEVTLTGAGPPARWSASGGRDYRIPADTSSTNTTFYLAGGTNGTYLFPLSDVWELSMSGTISANLATNNLYGSWNSQQIKTAAVGGVSVDQASTVLSSSIVSVSGCNITDDASESCAEGNSYVMNPSASSEIAPPACPVPRYGGALAPNFCAYPSAGYATQVFLMLGTFNSSYWDDQGGLQRGEVAVLDIETGSWSRILPAGDPGTTGIPAYPSPREGAVALSFATALVGQNRAIASDTIVFGGKDESGTYLNEVWILRAYNGSISSTNGSWGAPDGPLQTGVDANGAGVTNQYMTECAVELVSPTTTAPGGTTTGTNQSFEAYDVSFAHKLLAPLSIALLLPAILLSRVALPSAQTQHPMDRNIALVYLSGLVALAAYGAGIGGLISSFTSITTTMTMLKRAPSGTILRTGHGVAGLALIVGLYAVVPFLYLLSICASSSKRTPKVFVENSEPLASRANSTDTAEKLAAYTGAQRTEYPPASPTTPRTRLHSWGGSSFWLGRSSREGRASTDSESIHSAGPARAFEVVNRPARTRRASSQGLAHPSMDVYQRVPVAPRSLGDVDWLDRRRSLNAVNELDYAEHQGHHRANGFSNSSTPPTIEVLSTRALVPHATYPRAIYELPQPFETCLRILFHALVLALCILSLAALWYRATKALFAVFLLWTALFYCSLFALAWNGRPRKSILTSLVARLRAEPPPPAGSPETPTSRPLSITGAEQYPFPTDTRGPYLHQPLYRPAGHDDVSTSHGPRSVETDDDDEDVDEETRQRRIEEEMGRREVSIVTVPKRRLWITNPS
ncbi:hypothetical protein BJ138DRAFT_1123641 [Hygrophoropsis aurantiaca]|uniref:Uncharacterized protein n=1 Tax=Hygrophoropsis aurantiaca TaxID=72124 RepID=A0ACB8AMH6_9AGAM|nr:hypothetical protein BJ138DRAFT_1123641 [Hygrophoropsis aurantiaca]